MHETGVVSDKSTMKLQSQVRNTLLLTSDVSSDSLLSTLPLKECPAAELQRVAAEEIESGCRCDTMSAIANMGTHGKHPSNLERDLHRRLPEPLKLQQYVIPLPTARTDGEGVVDCL